MLEVQAYLRAGKTLEDLQQEWGVVSLRHPTLPLAVLNYSQLDSPKTHPITKEARGLVLNTADYSLVARAFPRFYNWGEVPEEMPFFDWQSCRAEEKVDGSLVLLYHFDGRWRANTRGSFADFPLIPDEYLARYYGVPRDFTWNDGILKALGVKSLEELGLDKSLTYVCEFCSQWNKVVRDYPEPCMYQLTRFAGEEEIGASPHPAFRNLVQYPLGSADEVTAFINAHPEATFEGVVVKDAAYRRWKLKNARYVTLHHVKGNGAGLYRPKNLIPYILQNEGAELLTYFPEVGPVFNEYKEKVDSAFAALEELWLQCKEIESQKEFAGAILGKTRFPGLLFDLRKRGGSLRASWQNQAEVILKVLFE